MKSLSDSGILNLVQIFFKGNNTEDCMPIDSPVNTDFDDDEMQNAELLFTGEPHCYQCIVRSSIYIEIKSEQDLVLVASMLGAYVATPSRINMQQAK